MAIFKEFDLEIQSMKLVRGYGLTKMIVDNEIGADGEIKFDDEININNE